MPSGHFTKTTTRTTTALLAASIVDPTLICLTSALAIAPVAAGGLAYHAAKKGINSSKKALVTRKEKKAAKAQASPEAATSSARSLPDDAILDEGVPATAGGPSPEQLVEYEACVRKIAAAATGVAIQGSMAALMPHLSVVVVVNSIDLVSAIKQLRELRKQDVHRAVGGLSKTEHVIVGVVMKTLATGLTLGHGDFVAVDHFVEGHNLTADGLFGKGMSEESWARKVEALFGGKDSVGLHVEGVAGADHATAGQSDAVEGGNGGVPVVVQHDAAQMHQDILQHHVIHEVNAVANYAPDEIERYLGLGDGWRPDELAGTDRHSGFANVAIVGTVAAGMDVVITKALEDPVHKAIDKAELWRLERGGLVQHHVDDEGKLLEMDADRGMARKGRLQHSFNRKAVPEAAPPVLPPRAEKQALAEDAH